MGKKDIITKNYIRRPEFLQIFSITGYMVEKIESSQIS